MTESNAPEVPHVLAADDWPDIPARNELVLDELAGKTVIAINRFEACDEHEDADDHDREGGLCFARGFNVPIDPADLARELLRFAPEPEPVAWLDSDEQVWTAWMDGVWRCITRSSHGHMALSHVGAPDEPLTALYAHPPVPAEAAPGVLDAKAMGDLVKQATYGRDRGDALEPVHRSWEHVGADMLHDLATAGLKVVPAEPATAPSIEQIAEVLTQHGSYHTPKVTRGVAEAIHALYGTPGDEPTSHDSCVPVEDWDAQQARVRELEAEVERLNDVEGRLAALLCDLTDGLLSKTNYDVQTMVQHVEAAFDKHHQEDMAPVLAEVERYKAALEAAGAVINAQADASLKSAEVLRWVDARDLALQRVEDKQAEYTAARAALASDGEVQ